MRDWCEIGALALRALDIDVNPLAIAAALGELVDPGLIHGHPARNAEFLSNILRHIGQSEFSHRGSPGPARPWLPRSLSFGEKLLNDRRGLRGARYEKQMSVIEDLKAGVRDEPRHHARVDDRDD